jgi:D-arginine dehydrogenase
LLRSSTVRGLARRGDVWDITLERGTLTAGMVVNAAGARADHIAALAGLSPAGLSPLLRTAIIATCDPPATVHWPFVVDLDDQYYFEPFGAQILASPADETPATAGHVRPDDLDVALCIERLHERTRLHVRRVTTSWAGLRTFAADRRPVLGPHPEDPSFLWCAGLGGFGIMTAPACGDIVADHVLGRPRSDLSRACLPTRQAASA